MNDQIPLSYNPIDQESLANVLRQYQDRPHAEIVTDFEKAIAATTGAKYVLALNSGTAAIHLALKILDIGPGDEVLAPTSTYIATINPILYLGATPVLVDSERDTWNMDPVLAEQAIRSRPVKPKAMMVVHSYGTPAKMDELLSVSHKYGIPMVEDAAESIGSFYKGKALGTLGTVGVLSFNNNKIITTYGGGAMLTNDEALFRRASLLASQARENKPYYEHLQVGYNYRMGALNAAYGLAQWDNLQAILVARKEIFDLYKTAFRGSPIDLLDSQPHTTSNYWLITGLIKNPAVSYLPYVKAKLDERGIETRPIWKPMHLQSMLKSAPATLNGISEQLFTSGICLPASLPDKENSVARIKSALLSCFGT